MDNTSIFGNAYDDEDLEEEVDMNNVISSYSVPDTSFTKFHKDHPKDQVIGSLKTPVQIRHMTKITEEHGLQVKQKSDGIFISQDKYVDEILKKFDFASVKTASTLMETNKALIKDEEAEDVDVYLYRSMIGSLMYLTASRLDIMFVVYACARFQVTPKISQFNDVKRIFRYLKGQPTLGLWYPKDLPFDLEAFSDSDYTGASLDRKSTIGGCQFLGKRLISWQCKKQTIVANSTTEAEYVAAANCCGQVGNEVVHKELGDRMEMAATTASSFEAEHDNERELSDKTGKKCMVRKRMRIMCEHKTERENVENLPWALMNVPTYVSLIEHFGKLLCFVPNEDGVMLSLLPLMEETKIIIKASIRRHPQLLRSESVVAVEEDLKQTKKVYSSALTKLVLKVKKLEKQDGGTSWFQEDPEKTSTDTEILVEQETLTELIENLRSGEKESFKRRKQAKAMAEQEQERINFEAALELPKQLNEREEVPTKATQSQTID
ncbi:hypothetical protein Tco_0303715 [Tanacetum coccineum]